MGEDSAEDQGPEFFQSPAPTRFFTKAPEGQARKDACAGYLPQFAPNSLSAFGFLCEGAAVAADRQGSRVIKRLPPGPGQPFNSNEPICLDQSSVSL